MSTKRRRSERAEQILGKVSAAAQKMAVACETVHVNDFPAEGILATAKAKQCDLIVMAITRTPRRCAPVAWQSSGPSRGAEHHASVDLPLTPRQLTGKHRAATTRLHGPPATAAPRP